MDRAKSWEKSKNLALWVSLLAPLLMIVATVLPQFSLFERRPQDHLSVHLLLEMFSITVSTMVVSMAWSALSRDSAATEKALVFGFTVIAGADMAHAIVYDGMPSLIVDGSTREAIFFWLSGRTFEVITVLIVAAGINLPLPRGFWLGTGLSVALALFISGTYKLDWFPVTFVPGFGVTVFKTRYEYLLSAANLLLAFWLFVQSLRAQCVRHLWLSVACLIMGIGELAFTHYVATSDFLNVFGHVYKTLAYAFIYKATFLYGVQEPYELLERSELHIRSQKQELHNLLHNLPVGISRLDKMLSFRYLNPALCRSLNGAAQEMLGRMATRFCRKILRGSSSRIFGLRCRGATARAWWNT